VLATGPSSDMHNQKRPAGSTPLVWFDAAGDADLLAVARAFMAFLDAHPYKKVAERCEVYKTFQSWCVESGSPSGSFGAVLYRMGRELGRVQVKGGEEIKWLDDPSAAQKQRKGTGNSNKGSGTHKAPGQSRSEPLHNTQPGPYTQPPIKFSHGRAAGEGQQFEQELQTMSGQKHHRREAATGLSFREAVLVSAVLLPGQQEEGFHPLVCSAEECRQACDLLRWSSVIAVVVKPATSHGDKAEHAPQAREQLMFSMLQLASRDYVFLFDVASASVSLFESGLRTLLEDPQRTVVVHGAAYVTSMFCAAGIRFANLIDSELLDREFHKRASSRPLQELLRAFTASDEQVRV
jgi:hypothetical protein